MNCAINLRLKRSFCTSAKVINDGIDEAIEKPFSFSNLTNFWIFKTSKFFELRIRFFLDFFNKNIFAKKNKSIFV